MSRERGAAAAVVAVLVLTVAVAVVTIVGSWGRLGADGFGTFGAAAAIRVAAYCAYALVGGLVAARRPDNPIGWIFFVGGTAMTVQLGLEEYAQTAVVLEPGVWPATAVVDWVAEWMWVVPMTALQFSMLLFPTGRLPSPRWRPVAAAVLAGDALLLVLAPVATWPLRGRLAGDEELLLQSPLWVVLKPVAIVMMVATVLSALSLVMRHRRATGEERYQLRWLAFAAVIFVVAVSIENVFGVSALEGGAARAVWPSFVGAVGTIAVPVAAAFAILKRRLYEIDRIISRVLAYALVTALLLSAHLCLVLVLGAAARAVTGESGDLVVALSTLGVAAVARPLLDRIRGLVDRRFNRARYDAARTVDAFGRSLRDEVSRDAVLDALRRTTAVTFQPARVGVLLTVQKSP